jgi:nitroreductase
MCSDNDDQKNMFLDRILAERRSYRMFKPEFPPEDAIRRIIHGGLHLQQQPWEIHRNISAGFL